MRDTTRAQRRHDVQRLKKSRKKYWGNQKTVAGSGEGLTDRQLGILVHTSAVCSCAMCGNPRSTQKELTIQERRIFQDPDVN